MNLTLISHTNINIICSHLCACNSVRSLKSNIFDPTDPNSLFSQPPPEYYFGGVHCTWISHWSLTHTYNSEGSTLFDSKPVAVWNYWVNGYKRNLSYFKTTSGASEVVLRTQEVPQISLVTINSVVPHGNSWRCDPTEYNGIRLILLYKWMLLYIVPPTYSTQPPLEYYLGGAQIWLSQRTPNASPVYKVWARCTTPCISPRAEWLERC
jgi:hypothetical protein